MNRLGLRERSATALMLTSVLLNSLVPTLVALGGERSPFVFNTAWGIGELAGYPFVLLMFFRRESADKFVWKTASKRTLTTPMLLWASAFASLGVYALSTRFTDVSVATALKETWPLFFVVIAWTLFRKEGRYRRPSAKSLSMFGFAVLGAALVAASQSTDAAFAFNRLASAENLLGASLAVASAFVASLRVYGFKWAQDFARRLIENGRTESERRLETFGAVAGTAISGVVGVAFTALTALALNERVSANALLWGGAGGLILGTGGTLCFRLANLFSRDLEVNALVYLTPVLSLGWLFAFSQVGNVHAGLLLAGAALISAGNAGAYLSARSKKDES